MNLTKYGHVTRHGHRRSFTEGLEAPPVWGSTYRYSGGERIALGLAEDTNDNAKNPKEPAGRSATDRRRVVCERNPVLRQAGICKDRGENLHFLPRDIG